MPVQHLIPPFLAASVAAAFRISVLFAISDRLDPIASNISVEMAVGLGHHLPPYARAQAPPQRGLVGFWIYKNRSSARLLQNLFFLIICMWGFFNTLG
jgi:hypothetical protein